MLGKCFIFEGLNELGKIKKAKMKLITKEESIKLLGRKKGFFGQGMSLDSIAIFYLGGITELDDELDCKGYELKDQMSFINVYPKGYELEVNVSLKYYRSPILQNNLKSWTLEKQDAVYEQEAKSAVGRAVVGGLLFGGAGAIVGALTGTKSERKKVGFIDYVLTLIIEEDGVEKALILGFPNIFIKDIRVFFNKYFPNTYCEPDKLNFNNKTENSLSIADEIIKFKSLLDNGIITQEEFDIQKNKLLTK